jgi:uncharacterized protein YggE
MKRCAHQALNRTPIQEDVQMQRTTISRYLALTTGAALLSMAAPLARAQRVDAQGSTEARAGEVRASGFATVAMEPDLALVTVQYSASGKTPAAAGKAAAARADAIRRAIEALGIPRDSMPTSGGNRWWGGSRAQMEFRREMRDTVYVSTDAFTVRIRNFALIGRVIDTALAHGAQTISNVSFQATNDGPSRLRAIRDATVQAKANANAIAEASGLRMGRAIEISTEVQPYMMAQGESFERSAMMKADVGTQVVAPELKITMTVHGRWEMVLPR